MHDINPNDLPDDPHSFCSPHIRLPRPCGRYWRLLVNTVHNKHDRAIEDRLEKQVVEMALRAAIEEERVTRKLSASDLSKLRRAKKKAKLNKTKTVAAGQEPPPSNLRQAWHHPTRDFMWVDAAYKEFNGLTELGVFKHDFTEQELLDLGIDIKIRKPISLSVVLDHKYKDTGDKGLFLDRLKVRMCIAGHAGNLKRHIDYSKTFAPSPNQHTMRLLQSILVANRWHRFSFDITQAYLHAELGPEDAPVVVRYPDGFKRYDKDGNETYMMLAKNAYGLPTASRNWSRDRDAFILDAFNKGEWSCHRCVMDPCLFHFKKHKGGDKYDEVIALIYTDDVDMIGGSEDMMKEIFDVCHAKWGCRKEDSDFVLGVKRTLNEDRTEVVLTMTSYIDGMVEMFKEYLPNKNKTTPFPEHTFLSKYDKSVTDEEVKRVIERGYQKLVGQLLWVARNCAPEIAAGVSQLCKVMSRPSETAWNAGMHMVSWLRSRRLHGIRFSHDGNTCPIAFSDASNKVDPYDGKAQYGFVVMINNGPGHHLL